MKPFLPIAMAGLLLLSGCPDTQVPKAPPKVPEPKAASVAPQAHIMVAGLNVHTPA